MAYKRKSSAFRSPPKIKRIRKSRAWWSGAAVPRPVARGSGSGQIVRISRHCDLTTLTLDGSVKYLGLQFQLNQLPNNTEFDLYDQYRIRYVKVMFTSNTQPVNNNSTSNQVAPQLITAVDYDDATTPTSLDNLYNYNNCKIHGALTPMIPYFARSVKPMVAQAVFAGVTSGYSPRSDVWLDTAKKDIPHYGIKVALNTPPNAASGIIVVQAVFYCEFKLPN